MALFFRFTVFIIVASAAIYFAVLNRADTPFIWSPLEAPLTLPVFLIGLGGVGIGFIMGALYVWFNTGKLRTEKRALKKELNNLKKDLEQKRKELHKKSDDEDDTTSLLENAKL